MKSQNQTMQRDIRVVLQQPALPAYRLAVFRELAHRPGIDLRLAYSERAGLSNVEPEGFAGECVKMRLIGIGGRTMYWHGPQFSAATRRRADVVILSWDMHYLSLVPALVRARLSRVGTVLWGHGYSKNESELRKRVRNSVTGLASSIMFYNNMAADRFGRSDKVFVALNSLDQTPIQQQRSLWIGRNDWQRAFRKEHGLGDDPVVLFVSRLEPANRVDLLLKACALLSKTDQPIRVVVIGKGENLDELKQQARELGVKDRVVFTGPIYAQEHLAPWFLISDVFCYPANVGLSMLHAMGYGLPVVTSDRTDAQNPEIEALQAGENGLLYQDDNAEDLARVLKTVVNDDGLRQKLSAGALHTAMERFTVQRMVDGMEAAIRHAFDKTH